MAEQKYQTFSLHYDSSNPDSPLYQHSMSSGELAQIISSFGSLMRAVNKVVNGPDSEISVRVHAFEEGSFGIPFEILQSPEAMDVLKSLGIIITGGAISFAGVMSAIQKLKRRKITQIKYVQKNNEYVLHVENETIICTKTEKALLTNETVRKMLGKVFVEPLSEYKADSLSLSVELRGGDEVVESSSLDLTLEDVENFAAPETVLEEFSEDVDTETPVHFKSAFAEQDTDWEIDLFGKELKVKILDNTFLSMVNTGKVEISFGRPYKVKLRETITTKSGSKRTSKKYSIIKVLDN